MIQFTSSTLIYRPINRVFDFISNPENDFQWQYGTLASNQLSGGAMCLGACFQSVGNFAGQRIQATYEVTEYEPHSRYGFKSLSGPLQSVSSFVLNIVLGSTQVKFCMQANPGSTMELSESVLEKKMRRQFKENLMMLKSILEARK